MRTRFLLKTLFVILTALHVELALALDIKGIHLGDTREQILKLMPDLKCESDKPDSEWCAMPISFGAQAAYIQVHLISSEASAVRVMFDTANFDTIRDALSSKYGTPTELPDADRLNWSENGVGLALWHHAMRKKDENGSTEASNIEPDPDHSCAFLWQAVTPNSSPKAAQ